MKTLIRLSVSLLVTLYTLAAFAQDAKSIAYQMIDAASLGNESKVLELKSRIELLPKPSKGDRKVARGLNDAALKQLAASDYSGAILTLERALQADPSDVEISNNLGYALLKAKEYQKAQMAIIDSIVLSPGRSGAWYNLGQVFGELGDKRARAVFNIAYTFSQNKDKTKEYLIKLIDDPASPPDLVSAATLALGDEGIKPLPLSPEQTETPQVAQVQQNLTAQQAVPAKLADTTPPVKQSEGQQSTPSSQPPVQSEALAATLTSSSTKYAIQAGLVLIATLALLVGLYKPSIVLRGIDKPTRLKVIGGWLAIVVLVVVVVDKLAGKEPKLDTQPAIPESKASLVGQWDCVTQNPNGSTSRDIWKFGQDKTVLINFETPVTGVYANEGPSVVVLTIRIGGGTVHVRVDIEHLSSSELRMVSTTKSGHQRTSSCKRH